MMLTPEEVDNYVGLGGTSNLWSGDYGSPGYYANELTRFLSGSGGSGGINLGGLLSAGAGGVAGLLGGGGGGQRPTGYQGKIPKYTAVRQQVPMPAQDPARRPGSMGRRYFTDTQFVPQADNTGIAAAQQNAQVQQAQITEQNQANQAADNNTNWYAGDGGYRGGHIPDFAQGGLLGLAQGGATGYYLGGKTDGMADKIPATIANKQPAKLSHGEFVLPSDIVSALGSGNSEAGAEVLYKMMDRIRKHAHGHTKQIKPANPKKVLPA
jgi:hypothetical protein